MIKVKMQEEHQLFNSDSLKNWGQLIFSYIGIIIFIFLVLIFGLKYPFLTRAVIWILILTGVFLILFKGIYTGLKMFILFFPIAQVIKMPIWQVSVQAVTVMIGEFLILALIVRWIYDQKTISNNYRYNQPIVKIAGIFVVICCFSLVLGSRYLSLKQAVFSGLYIVRWIEYAFLYFIVRDTVKSREDFQEIIRLLLTSVFTIIVLGIIQYFVFPDLGYWRNLNLDYGFFKTAIYDPHLERIFSTFMDPNFLSGFLAFYLVVFVSLFIYLNEMKLYFYLLYIVFFCTFVLTYSRAGYLTAFIGLSIVLLYQVFKRDYEKTRKLIIVALVSLIVFTAFPRAISRILGTVDKREGILYVEPSANARLITWKQSLVVIGKNPVIGVGYNSYKWALQRYRLGNAQGASSNGAQNSFLTITATTGFIGLGAFTVLLICMFKNAYKSLQEADDPWVKGISIGFIGGLGALMVHAIFIESLTYPQIIATLWIFSGLLSRSYLVNQVNQSNLPEEAGSVKCT
jgi:O-antigen ligase